MRALISALVTALAVGACTSRPAPAPSNEPSRPLRALPSERRIERPETSSVPAPEPTRSSAPKDWDLRVVLPAGPNISQYPGRLLPLPSGGFLLFYTRENARTDEYDAVLRAVEPDGDPDTSFRRGDALDVGRSGGGDPLILHDPVRARGGDGSLFLVSGYATAFDGRFEVVRIAPEGRIDERFSERHDAVETEADEDQRPKLTVLPDGRARVCFTGRMRRPKLFGLTAAGRPDPSVGRGGIRTLRIDAPCEKILVHPGGRMLAVTRDALWALEPDGDVDEDFGDGGVARLVRDGLRMRPDAARWAKDGTIVVAGVSAPRDAAPEACASSDTDQACTWTLAHLTADGSWTDGLDGNGFATYPTRDALHDLGGVILDLTPSGEILTGRQSRLDPTNRSGDIEYRTTLLRIDLDTGRVDRSFGEDGSLVVHFKAARALPISDDRLVAFGNAYIDGRSRLILRRVAV